GGSRHADGEDEFRGGELRGCAPLKSACVLLARARGRPWPGARGADGGAVRRAERAGDLRHPLGLLVPEPGGGLRRGERAGGDPRAGGRVQHEEPPLVAGRGGEEGAREDQKLIRIVLTKTKRDARNCWTSLLENEYVADLWIQDQMQKKLTLERFHKENPGFDFTGADISGNYSKGGPDFSSLER
uniref:NudC domain containing 2 n=1 Tax=Varanus komodoensis TaxID=61221 RepID=A0A8D2J494_VARKO